MNLAVSRLSPGAQQAAVPPSCSFFPGWPENIREAHRRSERLTVAQGGPARSRMVPRGSQRSSEKPRYAQEEKVVASSVFRRENEHPQRTLRFSSFFRNQLG